MTMLKFVMFKFHVKLYDHDTCHLNKQVITKLKVAAYHLFSLYRPKVIKETFFNVMYVMCHLSCRGLATLADYWPNTLYEVRIP